MDEWIGIPYGQKNEWIGRRKSKVSGRVEKLHETVDEYTEAWHDECKGLVVWQERRVDGKRATFNGPIPRKKYLVSSTPNGIQNGDKIYPNTDMN